MRTPTDALRSLNRYVALALGPEWEVQFAPEDGVFDRPFARVNPASAATHTGTAWWREYKQSFAIVCYPEEKLPAEEARIEAARVEDLLFRAFGVGVHQPSFGVQRMWLPGLNVGRAHPMRVPLYDYDGIALSDAATEGDRDTRDFMRLIEDPQVQTIEEPEQPTAYIVVANIRMSWCRSAAVTSAGVTTQSVRATEEGT